MRRVSAVVSAKRLGGAFRRMSPGAGAYGHRARGAWKSQARAHMGRFVQQGGQPHLGAWVWITINLAIGLPLAAWLVVLARECVRSITASCVGFRVFGLQAGLGTPRLERALGPLDVSLAPWPFAGEALSRTGSPRRHRLARALISVTPLMAQCAWLWGRSLAGAGPALGLLSEPLSPLACLDLANALLLWLHAVLAIEFSDGVRTDVRRLLDVCSDSPDTNRAARADYYARLGLHRLERGNATGARSALDQSLDQLGPRTLLVACRQRLGSAGFESVVDQSACADDLRGLIRAARPRRHRERWTLRERVGQTALSLTPLLLATTALTVAQADLLAHSLEEGLLVTTDRAVKSADPQACEKAVLHWRHWSNTRDRWLPPTITELSDRHTELSRLARCRGDLEAAAAHTSEAMQAARAVLASPSTDTYRDPESWIQNELRLTTLFRHTAAVEHQRSARQRALATLTLADKRLERLRERLVIIGDAAVRGVAEASLDTAHREIAADRARVLGAGPGD